LPRLGRLMLLLALSLSGCASSEATSQQRLGEEFVAARPTSRTRAGWRDDIYPQQLAIDRMKATARSEGAALIAATYLRSGVHPYAVVGFLRVGDSVQVVETAMYWGIVKGKWEATATPEALTAFLTEVERVLACAPRAPFEAGAGALVVHWPSEGEQRVCSAEWLSEQAALVDELLEPLLAGAQQTYGTVEQ
jgi:hypothetical protein